MISKVQVLQLRPEGPLYAIFPVGCDVFITQSNLRRNMKGDRKHPFFTAVHTSKASVSPSPPPWTILQVSPLIGVPVDVGDLLRPSVVSQ